ncbi:MAG: hypothetical protein ACOC8E_09030, partial [Planctomycetota bacterium]
MEQLTPGEWAREQVRRAPSFAAATAVVKALMILSMFINYSSARPAPPPIPPILIGPVVPEPAPIEEFKTRVRPRKPRIEPPMKNPPEVKEPKDVRDEPIDPPE